MFRVHIVSYTWRWRYCLTPNYNYNASSRNKQVKSSNRAPVLKIDGGRRYIYGLNSHITALTYVLPLLIAIKTVATSFFMEIYMNVFDIPLCIWMTILPVTIHMHLAICLSQFSRLPVTRNVYQYDVLIITSQPYYRVTVLLNSFLAVYAPSN